MEVDEFHCISPIFCKFRDIISCKNASDESVWGLEIVWKHGFVVKDRQRNREKDKSSETCLHSLLKISPETSVKQYKVSSLLLYCFPDAQGAIFMHRYTTRHPTTP